MNSSYIQFEIPHYLLAHSEDYERHIVSRMEYAERELAVHLFNEIKKSKTPIVVDSHVEFWEDHIEMSRKYRLHYRLQAVRTMDDVMPVYKPLTFVNHAGVIEWKCPACSTINIIDATYCGEKHDRAIGCGRPREKTRQEM